MISLREEKSSAKIWLFIIIIIIIIINCNWVSPGGSGYFTYTGCNRRNGPDFGRVFLMLNYTEKPQNTYIQS